MVHALRNVRLRPQRLRNHRPDAHREERSDAPPQRGTRERSPEAQLVLRGIRGPNLLLFERPPAENYRADSGLLVENQWSAEDGDHYFTWVKKTGWEFIIPKEAGELGSRLVFKQLETEVHPDGTTRPRGTCRSVRARASARSLTNARRTRAHMSGA